MENIGILVDRLCNPQFIIDEDDLFSMIAWHEDSGTDPALIARLFAAWMYFKCNKYHTIALDSDRPFVTFLQSMTGVDVEYRSSNVTAVTRSATMCGLQTSDLIKTKTRRLI